ncbi:hypothetical protein ACFX13_045000 [Malus domestica]|uniref:Uncharacterized protein n=1 Tax=Malus domestica TaxID=3750 RepID=A0A498JCN1_MALDO|nr:hypothetical protein DVH24_033453 [Malus domestica]
MMRLESNCGEGSRRAERDAVRDGAGATRVGKNGGVDCKDVGHSEKRGSVGAGLGGESGAAFDGEAVVR